MCYPSCGEPKLTPRSWLSFLAHAPENFHTVRPMFRGRVLDVTEDILFEWRLLVEEGRKMGHTFSQPDLFIAAIALHHGLTVVTRNRKDFDKAHVPVFNPWEAAE